MSNTKAKELKLRVLEKIFTIQGEGLFAGRPTLFIRLEKCDLHCVWCDSNFGLAKPGLYEPAVVVPQSQWWNDYPDGLPVRHVCFTGGEPLLYMKEIAVWCCELFSQIRSKNWPYVQSITIETGGGRDILMFRKILRSYLLSYFPADSVSEMFYNVVSICLDYKLFSSGESLKMLSDNYSKEAVGFGDSVKFVIFDRKDLEEAFQVVAVYGLTYTNIFFSPCWDVDSKLFLDRCRMVTDAVMKWNSETGWKIGISLQTHKLIGVR